MKSKGNCFCIRVRHHKSKEIGQQESEKLSELNRSRSNATSRKNAKGRGMRASACPSSDGGAGGNVSGAAGTGGLDGGVTISVVSAAAISASDVAGGGCVGGGM